jgi:hypothetical protein
MERFPEMTSKVTMLARGAGMEDPGRVADDAPRRPDPEVPERARRRTFTAKYKLEVLAAEQIARLQVEKQRLEQELAKTRAGNFYRHFEFEPSPTDPLHLLLLIKDARAVIDRH